MELPILPPLTLDGTETRLEIDPIELKRFYMPLADYLIQKSAGHHRYIIGIAGPPGSGKSAFTLLMAAIINTKVGQEAAAPVGLDGWHFPNAYLDANTTTRNGKAISLRRVKGAPETFDAPSALQFLRSARQGKTLHYPVYSREMHEPIPSGGYLSPEHRLVLMEGNYLLLNFPGWHEFHSLFDSTIFITAPREELILSLRARHIRGGKELEAVERHLAFSDLPNLDLILSQSSPADIQFNKMDSRHIDNVIYPKIG